MLLKRDPWRGLPAAIQILFEPPLVLLIPRSTKIYKNVLPTGDIKLGAHV